MRTKCECNEIEECKTDGYKVTCQKCFTSWNCLAPKNAALKVKLIKAREDQQAEKVVLYRWMVEFKGHPKIDRILEIKLDKARKVLHQLRVENNL